MISASKAPQKHAKEQTCYQGSRRNALGDIFENVGVEGLFKLRLSADCWYKGQGGEYSPETSADEKPVFGAALNADGRFQGDETALTVTGNETPRTARPSYAGSVDCTDPPGDIQLQSSRQNKILSNASMAGKPANTQSHGDATISRRLSEATVADNDSIKNGHNLTAKEAAVSRSAISRAEQTESLYNMASGFHHRKCVRMPLVF